MKDLKVQIITVIIATVITLLCNGVLESWKNKNIAKLSEQERIWNLKAPIYMGLAEELEDLFIGTDFKNIDIKEREKKFNKICNKIFIVGNDAIVKQLNNMTGSVTVTDVGKVLILLRKELDSTTQLDPHDYKRRRFSAEIKK